MKLIKKSIILSILLISIFTTQAYSFGGFVKLGKLIFKSSTASKAGAGTSLGLLDNIVKETMDLKKLNNSLFTKINDVEHINIVKSLNKSDEVILAENNISSSISGSKEFDPSFYNSYGIWSAGRLAQFERIYKPNNQIYACEISNNIYYFILLPKRNLAILTNTNNKNYPKQSLEIIESSPAKTVLKTTQSKDGLVANFIFLPNYKIKYSSGTYSSTKSTEDGECGVAIDKVDAKLVRFDDQKDLSKTNDSFKVYLTEEQKKELISSKNQNNKPLNNNKILTPVFNSLAFYILTFNFIYLLFFASLQKKVDKNPKKYEQFLFFAHLGAPFILFVTVIILLTSLFSLNFPFYFNILIMAMIGFNLYSSVVMIFQGRNFLKYPDIFTLHSYNKVKLIGYTKIFVPILLYITIATFLFL